MSGTPPSELLMEILSRIPAYSLLRFRCVCKAWCRMIDHPYFIKIHTNRHLSRINDFSTGVGHILLLNDDLNRLGFLSLDMQKKLTEISHIGIPFLTLYKIVSSCNGLILLYHDIVRSWSIWNPLTQELHILPNHKVNINDRMHKVNINDRMLPDCEFITVGGLGYDSVSDDYKVLKHVQAYKHHSKTNQFDTCVYSLKSNSWKKIDNFPYSMRRWSSGTFLNGALHWIGTKENSHSDYFTIVAFNLETENCRLYSPPSSSIGRFMPTSNRDCFDLSELGGCLSLKLYYRSKCFEVWLMNDYGFENSWTKLFSIEETWLTKDLGVENPWTKLQQFEEMGSFFDIFTTITPISYSKSKGQVLLQTIDYKHIWFNINSNTVEMVILGRLGIGRHHIFTDSKVLPSLVRIRRKEEEASFVCF